MLHLCPNPARQYATLPDEQVLRDPGLSLTALGLLAKLMTAPVNASTDPKALAVRCGASRRSIKNAIRELTAAGLLLRTAVRHPSGQFITLVCDDAAMLRGEIARLNASGWFNLDGQSATAPGPERRGHQPRHARPAAGATRSQHAEAGMRGSQIRGSEPTRDSTAAHGEHYRHCVLRTTHAYINSNVGRPNAYAQLPCSGRTSTPEMIEDRCA